MSPATAALGPTSRGLAWPSKGEQLSAAGSALSFRKN